MMVHKQILGAALLLMCVLSAPLLLAQEGGRAHGGAERVLDRDAGAGDSGRDAEVDRAERDAEAARRGAEAVEPVRLRIISRQPRRSPVAAEPLSPREERRRAARLKQSPRHLESLDPEFRERVVAVLEALRAEGWEPVIISGRRTTAQQKRIVAAGNSRTMNSLHLCGRAVDIADARHGWRGAARSPDFPFWEALGRASRAQGLIWGGDWKRPDIPHVQSRQRCR